MLYIYILSILIILSIIQMFTKRNFKWIFLISSLLLMLLSAIRYGSGTDYFSYNYHYNIIPDNIAELADVSGQEIGYKLLMFLTKKLGINYSGFIIIISIFTMSIFTKYIIKNSNYKMLSLLMFYCVYYHIYVNSGLRQGIALAIFFLGFYKYFKKNKTKKYVLTIVIASLFHRSVLITLLIPIIKVMYNKYFKNITFNIVIIFIAISSFLLGGEKIIVLVAEMVGFNIAYSAVGANLMAIALRIVMVVAMYMLYKGVNKNMLSEFDKIEIYIFFIGMMIFIGVSNMPTLSRMIEYFGILEVIIIPNLIYKISEKNKLYKIVFTIFAILVSSTIFIKDLNSFLVEGRYYQKDIFKYPYVTIFNKDEIYLYRESSRVQIID